MNRWSHRLFFESINWDFTARGNLSGHPAHGERTVGNHIASIYNKLGIYDRAQAIVYAIKKGIIRV